MKDKFRFHVLLLAAMQAGAYDPAVIQHGWKLVDTKVRDYFQRGGPVINTPTLFPFLLSQRNREAAAFMLDETKMRWNERLSTGKYGIVATVRYMPPLSMDDASGGNGLHCDFSDAVSAGYEESPYELKYTTTTAKITVDNATVRCIKEGRDEFSADSIANLLRAAVSSLARDVETVIYNIDNRYIGNFPDRHNGANRLPGKALNLFRDTTNAYNEVNWVEEANMKMDIKQASISDIVLFGGTIAQYYADLKNWSVENNNAGFDITKAQSFQAQNFIYDDYLQLGITNVPAPNNVTPFNPLLAVRPGALQFVSRARTENPDFQINLDDQISTTFVDPVWGLTWEMNMKLDRCPTDGEYKWYTWFRLDWTVIGYPQCDHATDPKLVDVRDVFLYNVGCGDTPVCDMPVDEFATPMKSLVLDESCTVDEVCAPTCDVALYGSFLENGDYQIVAVPSPAAGADPLVSGDYAWEVNSAPVATPTDPNVLVLAAGAYANGDTVDITITDSTTCVATAALVISVPELQVIADDGTTANVVPDGGTETLTSVLQANSPVVSVDLSNLGLNPLKVTAWTFAGALKAGFVQPVIPSPYQDVPVSHEFEFDNTSTGLKQVTVAITSNDPTTPSYSATIEITLT